MSAGLTASSGLLQGVSQYEAGQQKGRLFNADAGIAARQMQSEEQAGSYNETIVRQRGAQITGQQVANTGANNLQQTGTPAQVISSTAETNEMDALQTRNNALRKAWGFQVQQQSDLTQSSFAKSAGDFSAAGSILSGGAKGYTEDKAAGSWF
jgi:hypothetical protein